MVNVSQNGVKKARLKPETIFWKFSMRVTTWLCGMRGITLGKNSEPILLIQLTPDTTFLVTVLFHGFIHHSENEGDKV